jgi:hypothetical protein
MAEVSDTELKAVIADFLDMGLVENIVAMFRREPRYYAWSGELLNDSRFQVRLGMAVLFEELRMVDHDTIDLATPSLIALLQTTPPLPLFIRGDALGLLAIIDSDQAMNEVRALTHDDDIQLAAMARELLGEEA